MEKLRPALRNRFKDLIIIFPAVAEVVEVSLNSVGPGSANAFDQVWQFRKDIVPPALVKSSIPGCKTWEALINHRLLGAVTFYFFFSCSKCYL